MMIEPTEAEMAAAEIDLLRTELKEWQHAFHVADRDRDRYRELLRQNRETLRGHRIFWCEENKEYRYGDTGQPTASTWMDRPCGVCMENTNCDGHDPCLGTLPGVVNACCGHGDRKSSYVVFENGRVLRGFIVEPEGDRNG